MCAIRIKTGARLHFGLLDTALPFGGVGVMIDQPETEIVVTPSAKFGCDSELLDRVRPIAERISLATGLDALPACHVAVVSRAMPHSGLGSGTQLALATTEAICLAIGLSLEREVLATELADRGKRSAVGMHGYFHGGLILETGQDVDRLNPIQIRSDLPTDWRVAIFRPQAGVDPVSGAKEQEQFIRLPAADRSASAKLYDLAGQIMQAGQRNDFASFVDSVQEYNRQSGLLFESIQGGVYNGPEVSGLVDTLRNHGARGIGQSSWGPGVFAWFESQERAQSFSERLPDHINRIAIASPLNVGRHVEA